MAIYTNQMQAHCDRFEAALPAYMPATGGLQTVVTEAMAYACEGGGKRIRPVLLLEFCRLCGGNPEMAMPAAAAIEMIHSYSLVHDDLPCMDNSLLRRGKPSTHAVYGETMALLAGDGLLNLAFETILAPKNRGSLTADGVLGAASALADAAGIEGMVGGQVIDLDSEGKQIDLATLEALQRGKTAALLIAACVMGARMADATPAQEQAARTLARGSVCPSRLSTTFWTSPPTPPSWASRWVATPKMKRLRTYLCWAWMRLAVWPSSVPPRRWRRWLCSALTPTVCGSWQKLFCIEITKKGDFL